MVLTNLWCQVVSFVYEITERQTTSTRYDFQILDINETMSKTCLFQLAQPLESILDH
jgi:hypothetical protein